MIFSIIIEITICLRSMFTMVSLSPGLAQSPGAASPRLPLRCGAPGLAGGRRGALRRAAGDAGAGGSAAGGDGDGGDDAV